MPGVRDCAVFGIPDEEFGEQICALSSRCRQRRSSRGRCAAFLRRHLAATRCRAWCASRGLPREDSGKIFKRKLREPYWEAAGRRI